MFQTTNQLDMWHHISLQFTMAFLLALPHQGQMCESLNQDKKYLGMILEKNI